MLHTYVVKFYINNCFCMTCADEPNADSVKNSKGTALPSNTNCTPEQASTDFGILISNIIKELSKNEHENLELIKDVCSYLTIKDDSRALLFNEDQQKAINAYDNIRPLFREKLRHCWRWDDFSILTKIVQSLDSTDHCMKLINQYKKRIYIEMKLKDIHEFCKQESQDLPEGYYKMVAIVENKSFLHISLKEYMELKEFISQHCKVEPYVISPFTEAWFGSLLLEWFVPSTAVPHMIEMATVNTNIFIAQNFLFMKISSKVIFDKRDNVSY